MANEIIVTDFYSLLLLKIYNYVKEQVPEIAWCDLDVGQLELDMERPPVKFPCLLVDFLDTQYNELHQQTQEATGGIQLRLGFAPFSNTSFATPAEWLQKGVGYFALEQKVYKAFQYWHADQLCSPLTRTRAFTEKGREDTYRVRNMFFSTYWQDGDAILQKVQVTRPQLQVEELVGQAG